jgi:putative colanic acid biosynthesis acetyltransferase WcaB
MLTLLQTIRRDWIQNHHNTKIRFVLVMFRLAHVIAVQKTKRRLLWLAGVPVLVLYRVLVEWLLCIELPAKTMVGPGVRVFHGHSLVVNDHTVIGRNCVLRHCTTIGCVMLPNGDQGPSPVIGDDVEIGSNSVILGGIRIGDEAVVGAGSVVTKDVPPRAVVMGNPARVVRIKDQAACLPQS